MDYLPVPHGTSLPEVPYLLTPRLEATYRYDGGDWLTFLERKGWDKDAMYYRDTDDDDRHATPEAAAILQSWLLFGILFETLGLIPSHEIFVLSKSDGTRIVNFSCLDELIRAWIVRIREASEAQRRTIRERLDRLRDDAGGYITASGSQIIHGKTPLPYEAVIAILCLVSYLEIAKAHVYSELGQCLRISTPIPAAMKRDMLQKHWCPSDIQFLQGNIPSLVSIYQSSLLGPTDHTLSHDQCSPEEHCKARRLDSTYTMRHSTCSCDCPNMVSMDQSYLANTLLAEKTPLATAVDAIEGTRILPFPNRPSIRYVAISHVFAHGLGNESANAIPACQAIAIQNMVDGLYANNARTPFWLDTFSIPARGTSSSMFRSAAIGSMKDVYAAADKVLVIDKSLLTVSRDIGDLELAARIMNCDWMRRIWTSQEGAKSRELYFQFADGPLSIQQIVSKIDAAQQGEVFRPVATMMDQFLQPLIKLLQLGPQRTETGAENAFANALAAIQWREYEDEHAENVPRLLGQLTQRPSRHLSQPAASQRPPQSRRSLLSSLFAVGVGIAATALAQQVNRQSTTSTSSTAQLEPQPASPTATQRLLVEQGELPADILFQEGQKFTTPGWRWCPTNLSQRTPDGAFSSNRTCAVTRQGLRGTYFGIRIRTVPNGRLNKIFNLYNDNGGAIYIVQDLIANDQGGEPLMNSNLYQLTRFGVNIDSWIDSMTDPAIVLSKEPVLGSTPLAMAAIVEITQHSTTLITAQYKRRAVVSFVDAATKQSYVSAAGRVGGMQALQAHMSEELRLGYSAGWKTWLIT